MVKLRWLILGLSFVVIGLILTHDLQSINQDIGRHLKSGEIIWQTKAIYHTNLFSYTEPEHPFINHHWLSEVIFFGLVKLIGLSNLIIFKALIIVSAFVLLWSGISRRIRLVPGLIALTLALITFFNRSDVRPELFSYLFLAYFLLAIFWAKYQKNFIFLYTLPLVQLLWTNAHIYFALGPGLLFLFVLDQLTNPATRANAKRIWLILAGTILVTLINPNWIDGALLPFRILSDYGYTIVENQSIFFLNNYGIFSGLIGWFEISAILLLVSFVIAWKNGQRFLLFELLTAIVFVILGAKMIRNLGLYSLVFMPIMALNLSALPPWPVKQRFKMLIALVAIPLLILLGYQVTQNRFYQWFSLPYNFGTKIPGGGEAGVNFIKENQIHGPLFNNFDVGSFLIWKLYPTEKVFVDGRPEAYSVDFFEKIYKPMQADYRAWQTYSEKYAINYVFFDHRDITPWATNFLSKISTDPNWPLVYLDEASVIFLKNTKTNQALIKQFAR